MYKFKDGVLQIQRIDVPKLDINIMSDLQQSYRTYLEKTIYSDMKFLEEIIQSYPEYENYTLNVKVNPIEQHTYTKTQVSQGKYYYPVIGTVCINGLPVGRDMEILRIPYMDDYGKINVDGNSKVVLSVLRSSEDISYTMKTNTFNIAMPYANVQIQDTKKGVYVRYGKSKIEIEKLISAMLADVDDDTNITTIFRNTHLINNLSIHETTKNYYAKSALESQTDILEKYKSEQYRLGDTRKALNENLSIDRAAGCILSREVPGFPQYPEGTLITQAMIAEFKRARVNLLFVQDNTILTGYTIAARAPIIYTKIPKGTKNCQLLRRKLPQFINEAYIPEDVDLGIDNAVIISNNDPLDTELAEFLLITGVKEVNVYPGKTKKEIVYSFEREIVGNYTARLKELTTNIPNGRSADEWVYFYNNPNLDRVEATEWLTPHDLIAITSIMGNIFVTGNSNLLNRDTSFLKKTLMVNEIFSETLRATITDYFRHYKTNILTSISNASASNPFYNLTKKWISLMNERRYLSTVDSVNLIAEVSQVCHITNLMSSSAEVVDEMRHLAIPFYGRLCPFETPAGKKLGLVNTKAIGAKIKNGMIQAPFRKVLATANGIRISSNITWLTVKDELGKKFGDMLSLVPDPNNPGNYLNTPILARIPNPDVSDEPFIFSTIMSYELAGGYVDAYPEQFLSPTAALVPFVCSNNAIRISYGVAQMRQAIYLLNSDKPLVRTEMYEDIFSYSDTDKYYAPCSGTVVNIDNMHAEIQGMDGTIETVYMQGSGHQGQLDATFDILVSQGQMVKEGELLAEAHKYPQPFVVRAPYSGRIISISDNYIQIDRSASSIGSFVNLENVDGIAINNGRIMGQSAVFLNIHCSVGDYVHKGQILADTCMSRGGVYSPARNPIVAYISTAYNYEDGVHAFESASVDYTSIIAHNIDVKVSKRHNAYSRASSLQGFKYCGPGDTIGVINLKETISSANKTKMNVKANLKVNGIPYECKTIEDDMLSKTYRYHLLGLKKLQAGDKMSGRHGNKGVVSIVQHDSMAPQLKNGRTVNFCLNPCGVPSRMNLGQIWDAHLGLVATVLNIEIISNAYNGASPHDIEYLMRYAWTLANTIAIGDNVTGVYNKEIFDRVCMAFKELPRELHEHVWKNIANVIDWRDVFDEQGDAVLYDPETGTYFENKITIGCPTFLKLMQEADEKQNSRAGVLEEQYARTTSQPQKGDNSAKGQRMAEMEFMALAAYGAASVIDETINEKSDNTGRMVNNHLQQLGLPGKLPDWCCTSRSVDNLLYYMEAMGVKLEVPESITKIDARTSANKYTIDIPKMVNRYYTNIQRTGSANASDMVTDFDTLRD